MNSRNSTKCLSNRVVNFRLRVGGHIVSIGFSSGIIPSVSLLELHRLQATVSGLLCTYKIGLLISVVVALISLLIF